MQLKTSVIEVFSIFDPNEIRNLWREHWIRAMSRYHARRYGCMHFGKLFKRHLLDLVQRIGLNPWRAKEGALEAKRLFDLESIDGQCGRPLERKFPDKAD